MRMRISLIEQCSKQVSDKTLLILIFEVSLNSQMP